MMRMMMKSKIHRATVTQADLHYVGSVTIDASLMEAADLLDGEQVAIVDVTNGARLETYAIAGEAGSGIIGINGAAARLTKVGNKVIVMAFVLTTPEEAQSHHARVIIATPDNRAQESLDHPTMPTFPWKD